jgi:HlyD family secretion protein
LAPGKRNPVRIVIPIVVLCAVAVGAWLYVRETRKPKPMILSGTIEAKTVHVGSLAGGRVVRVLVDEGTAVRAGETIVTLETETIDRQLDEQRAAIAAARAQLANTIAGPRVEEIRSAAAVAENDERDRRRLASLYHEGVVSKQMLDQAATKAKTSTEQLRLLRAGARPEEIATARAQVEQQVKRLDTLMKQRAETDVHASVSGVVQSIGLRPGDIVTPNQAVAELLESDQLWVRIYVPETLLGHVKVDQPVKLRIDTFPNEWFNGKVVSVSSAGEYTPRNVQTRAQRAEQVFGVKVDVASDPRLKAGMTAEVDLGTKGNAE